MKEKNTISPTDIALDVYDDLRRVKVKVVALAVFIGQVASGGCIELEEEAAEGLYEFLEGIAEEIEEARSKISRIRRL